METGTAVGKFDLHRLYVKNDNMFMEQTSDTVLCTILEMVQTASHNAVDMLNVKLEAKAHCQIVDALERWDAEKVKRSMLDYIQGIMDF